MSEYGNYRLWGSFSYGIIFSPLTGAVLAVTTGRVHDFGPYAVHVLLCLVACCAATQLSFRPKARAPRGSYDDARSAGARDAHHGKLHDLRRVSEALTRGGVAAHLLLFFLLGGTGGAIDSFLWVDVQSRGGSTLIDGVALAVVAVSEVVVFFFSGRLLRLLGVDGSLALVLGCYVLRLVTYAGLHLEKRERWELLPVQLLNGVTFALFWSTANAYCRSIAPAGLETTMLGIMGAMTNLGSFALTFSGGQVFQRLGAAPLWVRAGEPETPPPADAPALLITHPSCCHTAEAPFGFLLLSERILLHPGLPAQLMLAALNALCLLVLAATTTQQRRSSMTQEGGDLLREPLLTAPVSEHDAACDMLQFLLCWSSHPAPGRPLLLHTLASDWDFGVACGQALVATWRPCCCPDLLQPLYPSRRRAAGTGQHSGRPCTGAWWAHLL